MLEVYSNVNDPDGFYGVKINNVRDSLRMRLNHEGEHLRAFGLHGADLESSSLGSTPSSHLLASARDLHSVGLHRTALSITQSVRGQIDQAATANDLLFEIAWRTGDWDLPIPSSKQMSSAGAFYSTLRSLHRSRDQESVRIVVDSAMKSEMLRLKDMGSERMTEIQQAVDSLLSLREVSLWLGPTVQRALGEGDYRSGALKQFSKTGSSARLVLVINALSAADSPDMYSQSGCTLHECPSSLLLNRARVETSSAI
jgi:ataxia telangiectasia mutated family protein